MRHEISAVLAGGSRWTVIHADNSEVLPTLPVIDVVVTDPPYGIGEAAGKNKSRGNAAAARDYGNADWDDRPVSMETINATVRAGRRCVIFGGNYYPLPASRCWLVWDKLNGSNDFADCELAWTNLDSAVRRLAYRWNGMIRQNNEERGSHPTQKPVGVMQWVVGLASDPGDVILDPFAGSGTTGVACLRLGRRFIGIERDEKYAQVARERLAAEDRGLSLRDARAGQTSIFDAIGGGP